MVTLELGKFLKTMYCEDNQTHMSIHPLHRLWYFMSRTLFVKGLNWMLRGLKVSCVLIVDTIPFVNISNFFQVKKPYNS